MNGQRERTVRALRYAIYASYSEEHEANIPGCRVPLNISSGNSSLVKASRTLSLLSKSSCKLSRVFIFSYPFSESFLGFKFFLKFKISTNELDRSISTSCMVILQIRILMFEIGGNCMYIYLFCKLNFLYPPFFLFHFEVHSDFFT